MVDKGSVVDRGLVENGDMVDTVGKMVGDGRAMETIMMEGDMVNSMGANSIIDSMSNRKAIFEYVLMANPHWDFLPISFTPLLFHPGGCLWFPEKRTSSRNYNLFVWSSVFQSKWHGIQKTYKNYQNPVKSYCFLGYFQSLFNFG